AGVSLGRGVVSLVSNAGALSTSHCGKRAGVFVVSGGRWMVEAWGGGPTVSLVQGFRGRRVAEGFRCPGGTLSLLAVDNWHTGVHKGACDRISAHGRCFPTRLTIHSGEHVRCEHSSLVVRWITECAGIAVALLDGACVL